VKTFVLAPRRNPPLELRVGDRTISGLHEVAVSNSDPFTFLGPRPFRVCPDASLDSDLDVLALTSIRTSSILRLVFKAFRTQSHTKMKNVRTLHDVERFTVTSARPVPYQVDGDYAGVDDVFEFSSDRGALSVLT
jgi:diacylglycerol kinase family enzyme